MKLKHWFFLIGLTCCMGILRVSQRQALWLASYRLGENQKNFNALKTQELWLASEVDNLRSPTELARAIKKDKKELVAWSRLDSVQLQGKASAGNQQLVMAQSSD
jgi:hypothetical protein